MAGAILISTEVGISMGSFAFDCIVDAIRQKVREEDPSMEDRLFKRFDEEEACFNMLTLWEFGPEEFAAFTRAAFSVMREALEQPADRPVKILEEMIEFLLQDPRYVAGERT